MYQEGARLYDMLGELSTQFYRASNEKDIEDRLASTVVQSAKAQSQREGGREMEKRHRS
jgi:hypothetical protein